MLDKQLVGKRIQALRKSLNLNQERFVEGIDITQQALSQIEKGAVLPSVDVLYKITSKYCISYESLLTGGGIYHTPKSLDLGNSVFNTQNTSIDTPLGKKMTPQLTPQSKIIDPLLETSEHKIEYKSPRSLPESWSAPKIITVNSEGHEAAVMIDTKAAAGLPHNIDNPQYFKSLPTIQLPQRQFGNGTHIVIQASGESMHPTIYHQDWIISRFEDHPAENMKDGYVYVIVSKAGVVIKRCLNRIKKRGMIVCQSDNNIGNPTYEIEIEDILQIYRAEAKLSFNLGNLNADMYKRLNNIEIEVADLRKQIEKPKNEE